MFKKSFLFILILQLFAATAAAQPSRQIEIFSINEEKVIKKVPVSLAAQQETKKFLEGITGIYTKINPIPEKGFMIRVPLDPNVEVKNRWFNGRVDEAILIFPEYENPYLMVFDRENRTLFFNFRGDTSRLLQLLKFKPVGARPDL